MLTASPHGLGGTPVLASAADRYPPTSRLQRLPTHCGLAPLTHASAITGKTPPAFFAGPMVRLGGSNALWGILLTERNSNGPRNCGGAAKARGRM